MYGAPWKPKVYTAAYKFRPCRNMGSFQTIIHSNNPEIFQEDTPLPTLSQSYIDTKHQDCLSGTQMPNIDKVDDIGQKKGTIWRL